MVQDCTAFMLWRRKRHMGILHGICDNVSSWGSTALPETFKLRLDKDSRCMHNVGWWRYRVSQWNLHTSCTSFSHLVTVKSFATAALKCQINCMNGVYLYRPFLAEAVSCSRTLWHNSKEESGFKLGVNLLFPWRPLYLENCFRKDIFKYST